MGAIDYTKLLGKLLPEAGGEDVLRLRTGVVDAVNSNGTANVGISGVVVPSLPVLGNLGGLAAGAVVQILTYRGSMLVLGSVNLNGSKPVELIDSGIGGGTATSTGGTNTLVGITPGIHGVAFIAPPSGKVFVTGRCSALNNTIAQYTMLDFEVKAGAVVGSGTIFQTINGNRESVFQSNPASQSGVHAPSGLAIGLTPGAAYNACLVYRVSANTGTFNRRYIAVLPQ
jgi:hypothetical protein